MSQKFSKQIDPDSSQRVIELDRDCNPGELSRSRAEACTPVESDWEGKGYLKDCHRERLPQEPVNLVCDSRATCALRETRSNARMRGETSRSWTLASNFDRPSTSTYPSSKASPSRNVEDSETRDKLLGSLHKRPGIDSNKKGAFENKNIMVEGCSIFLTDLPRLSKKVQAQVYDLLCGLGFGNQIVIEASGNGTISVQFSQPHVARAAYTILVARGWVLWNDAKNSYADEPVKTSNGNEDSECIAEPVITVQCNIPSARLEEEDLYRNLAKDIYEDDTENSSGSEIGTFPSTKPLLPPVEENVNQFLSSNQTELGVHLYKAFELPCSGTVVNDSPSNGAGAIKQRSCTSCVHRTSKNHEDRKQILINHVPIPKSPHNRARRVLVPTNDRPFITVSMRADIQLFHRQKPHYRLSKYSKPNYSAYRHTVDAVICGETAIIGYDRGPHQVSLLRFSSEGHSMCLDDLQVKPHQVSLDARNSKSTGAISCLAAKPMTSDHFKFFTGGHDRSLYIWNVKASNSITTERLTTLTTIPEALAFRHESLLIGTSRKLVQVDLRHLTSTPKSTQLSNSIHQIHIDEQAPNITLLEVNSLDFQVQIYDERIKHGFNRTADCYFGARQASSPAQANRGDIKSSTFVKGYQDGTVRMWDFRNLKDMGPIVHTTFVGEGIACYQENSLAFVELSGEGSLIVDK